MTKRMLGSLAGFSFVVTLVLSAASGCGLGVTEPRFQDDTADGPGNDDTALHLEEGGVHLAELPFLKDDGSTT